MEYNVKDVEIVSRLEDNLNLLELIILMAYQAKINFEDVFSPVRLWDMIIFNYLRERNIVIPQITQHLKARAYAGAYVKEPITGFHDWVVSFDLTSLYPSLIRNHNIGPETLLQEEIIDKISVDDCLIKKTDLSKLKKKNITVCPNGVCFDLANDSFISVLIGRFFDERVKYKMQMLENKRELEKINLEIKKRGLNDAGV